MATLLAGAAEFLPAIGGLTGLLSTFGKALSGGGGGGGILGGLTKQVGGILRNGGSNILGQIGNKVSSMASKFINPISRRVGDVGRTMNKWVGADAMAKHFADIGTTIDQKMPLNFTVQGGQSAGTALQNWMGAQYNHVMSSARDKIDSVIEGLGKRISSNMSAGVGGQSVQRVSDSSVPLSNQVGMIAQQALANPERFTSMEGLAGVAKSAGLQLADAIASRVGSAFNQ